MSRFLYRLTQEIVTSRNFSDANITRICRKHYRNSTYPDKERLVKTINDLKRKLEVQLGDLDHGSSEASSIEKRRCSCKKPKRSSKHGVEEIHQDKCISVQSFNKQPGLMVNHAVQMEGSSLHQHFSPLATKHCSDPFQKCRDEISSTDSISTITTYNFSSPLYSGSPVVNPRKSLEDTQTLIGQILSNPDQDDRMEDLMDSCCGRTKNSADSSADMVMRMAASDRVFLGRNDPKCPLHRCEEFGQSSVACVAASGGCGGGCGSDLPLPRPNTVEVESPQATCCGKRKSKKAGARKDSTSGKRKNGKKDKGCEQNRCGKK
ncbi:hypothetical protein RP20_CCG027136 [Aedes albopictus]|nr:hypothetical protein RP20_CCG027136 [Aedes albopictus]